MKSKIKKTIRIKRKNKLTYYLPRILAILIILFISLFALDSFSEFPFPESLLAFFIHLVPTYILIAITAIAWKWNRLGGSLFILLGALFILFTFKRADPDFWISYLIISLPLAIIGILFWFSKK